jgi:hypothetical protein
MKKYFIRWKSKVNGRIGQGSKSFTLEEAQDLIAELNADYPDIEHEIVQQTERVESTSEEARTEQVLAH